MTSKKRVRNLYVLSLNESLQDNVLAVCVLPYNNCPLISCSVASGQTSLTVSSACKLKNAINADEVNAVEINDIFSLLKKLTEPE